MASINQTLLIASITIIFTITTTTAAAAIVSSSDIYDILTQYGLPIGIIPNAVESYTLSPTDGSFTVHLTRPCYVQFDDQTVYYNKLIQGKLTYGSVSDVTGIQAKQLFLWLSVTGMDLDANSGMVEFHVGVLSKKLPADMFEDVPDCKSKACVHESNAQSM
ncbi:hypothetical protein QVD17_15004 [Tagetes erecta]|uniref:DUF538 domain-containing protein n=1 Tax=Tagetes erecta TaxID=13708 RepID=A0AAD8NYB4_TARER|nr:hypothetical protein QVD17_15004 [Tagetes erecta]